MGLRRRRAEVLAVIALGGAAGAVARYGIEHALPASGGFPWGTFVINASGCLAIGALMAVLAGLSAPHRLARPFVGIGFLGGFTTFSGYAVGLQLLVLDGRTGPAVAYLAATPIAAIALAWAGSRLGHRLITRRGGHS